MVNETAIVLCDGYFGTSMGKTANGLVRYSKRFKIVGIIDHTKHGKDAGEVLDGIHRDIPIYSDLNEIEVCPDFLIVGVASIGGRLPPEFYPIIRDAIRKGINIISGLHEFLSENETLRNLSKKYNVKILDIRKEPPLEKMHMFMNLCKDIKAVRIPVLGTDSSIGKRTTGIEIYKSLNEIGMKTVFVCTGQTGLLQGFEYGLPLDAIQPDYMVGELEHQIVTAYEKENPKVILIEGQGSISHPAYVCGTRAILMASQPTGIILQHAPKRIYRNYKTTQLRLPMPSLHKEIEMLELFSNSKVIGITINHENMSDEEIERVVNLYEKEFSVPVCDVLNHGTKKIVDKITTLVVD